MWIDTIEKLGAKFSNRCPGNSFVLSSYVIGIALLAMLVCGTGCRNPMNANSKITFANSDIAEDKVVPGEDPKPVAKKNANIVNEYLGLSEEQAMALAKEQNRRIQVGSRDGKSFALTADYVSGRITVKIEDGVICDADIEGHFIQ